MSCLGTGELLTLAIVIIIVFSASRMGQLGNALGRFVFSFKKAAQGDDLVDVTPKKLERSTDEARLAKPDKPG